jgi:hypothetical protein
MMAVLLTTLFARRADDAQAYDEVVVPFLHRMIMAFPVAGYPPDPPVPPLSDLLKDWSVVVRFGDRFERVYQRGDSKMSGEDETEGGPSDVAVISQGDGFVLQGRD